MSIRFGIQFGTTSGGDPLSSVSRDATSGIYCPATLGEWTTVMSAAGIASGNPSIINLLQDASGNPTDASGNGFALTASGTPVDYQQAVSGWSRFAITGSDGGTGVLDNTSASLPDPTAASLMMLTYAITTATPAAIRNYQVWGTGTITTTRINTTPRFQGLSGASTTTGTAAITGPVRPIVMQFDRTNNVVRCATDLEILTPAIAATAGKRHRISLDVTGGYLYNATFFNAAAEMSQANIKTLLQTLGWTIAW